MRYDILVCGIGGQGAISLGTALKLAALRQGLGVAGAERRGGAQREGVVTSNVRYFDENGGSAPAVSGLIPAGGGAYAHRHGAAGVPPPGPLPQ